jgi:hypothetical protein
MLFLHAQGLCMTWTQYSLQSLQDQPNELTSHARPLTSLRARSVQVRLSADFCAEPACTGFVHDLDTARYSLQSLTPPNEPTSHARLLTSLRAHSAGGATVCRLLAEPACTGFVHDLTQPGTACKVCRTPPNEPTSHALL